MTKPALNFLAHDWYPVPVPRSVGIGEGSWLYSAFAFIHCHSRRPDAVTIGRCCGVYNGCFFDLGPDAQVQIGDYCALVGVTFSTNRRVRIGDYCFLAHEVVIADSFDGLPWRAETANAAGRRKARRDEDGFAVVLGDDVWVGAGAVLLAGARIGDGAVLGAGAVVDFEVPSGSTVVGNPGRIIAGAG